MQTFITTTAMCGAAPAGNCTIMVTMLFPLPAVPLMTVCADVFNPKMWAKWFREFLDAHLPQRTESVGVAGTIRLVVLRVARSRLLPQREWKMKSWKQAL